MKKKMYFLLFAIIASVCYTLFYNAKTHVETVEAVDALVVKADSLTTQVEVLYREKDSAIAQIGILDSTLTLRDSTISKQKDALYGLKRIFMNTKPAPPIIIRDTVYITETKNFWGRKKTSIESTTTQDTLLEDLELDTVQ